MRRWFVVFLVLGLIAAVAPAAASANGNTALSACTTTQLNVVSYNASVAMGSVGDLFWVADIGSRACTLRGYPHISYWGNYGSVQSRIPAKALVVTESHGRHRFEFAGVAKDRKLPTVTLSPDGAIASFWVFGADIRGRLANGRQSRCIFSDAMWVSISKGPSVIIVTPERAGNFIFCGSVTIYPFVAGDTGADPPYPLGRMFGPTLP